VPEAVPLSLALFTPAWAVLGAFSTLDSGLPIWWGLAVGGLIGLLVGLIFGGYRGRLLDLLFGPEERD
jgi:hypothetical protein